MATLTPVEHDPFADDAAPSSGGKLVPVDIDPFFEEAPRETSLADDIKRQAGLLYRYGVEGATALPTMIGNIPIATANAVKGAYNMATDSDIPSIPYVNPFSEGLDVLGAPIPNTAAERVEGDVVRNLAGAGSLMKMGGEAVAKGSQFIGPKIAEILSSSPKMQLLSATTGGLGYGAAREGGAGEGGQVVAGLAGAMAPQALADGLQSAIRAILKGGADDADILANLDNFSAAGTTPSVGQATEARVPRWIESTLSRLPGSAGVMASRAERQADEIGKGVESIASSLAGKTEPTTTGMKIEKGITEDFIPKARKQQAKLYEKVDSYIAPESEIGASNTVNLLKDLNKPISGAKELSKTSLFGNKTTQDIEGALIKDMGGVAPKPSSILDEFGQPFMSAAKDGKNTMPYQAIKELRTRIGEKLSNFELASDIPRAELKRMYGALTQDMEAAAKQAGPEAYAAFKRANKYTSALHGRIDLLQNVVDKAGGPEKVFQSAISGTREGATTLNAVMKALPDDGKKALTATVLRRMGMAKPGKQNEFGDVFSTESFLTNWNSLSKEAKTTLFGQHSKQFNDDINKIAKVASNIREGSKVFANPSGTAAAQTNLGTLVLGSALFAGGNQAGAAAIAAGAGAANVAAKAMTNPRFVRWLAQNSDKPSSAWPAAINQLNQIATQNDDIELQDIAEQIAPIGNANAADTPNFEGILRNVEGMAKEKKEPLKLEITPKDKGASITVPESFKAAEGFRNKVYKDTTGHRTVGVGFNMDSGIARDVWQKAGIKKDFNAVRNGKQKVTEAEAQKLLEKSYEIARNDASSLVKDFDTLAKHRREALTHLAYQFGKPRLKQALPGVMAMVNQGNMKGAAARLLASDYGKKYKNRARSLARMLYNNSPYEG